LLADSVAPQGAVAVRSEDSDVAVTPLDSDMECSYQAIPALSTPLSDQDMTDIAWEDHAEDVVREDR
jgi:hypothetical protein